MENSYYFSLYHLGNSLPGECSLVDTNRIMSAQDVQLNVQGLLRTAAVRDPFGFFPRYGSDDQVSFKGLGDTLYREDGMALTFQLYTAVLTEDVALLSLLLNKNMWLFLSMKESGNVSIG